MSKKVPTTNRKYIFFEVSPLFYEYVGFVMEYSYDGDTITVHNVLYVI